MRCECYAADPATLVTWLCEPENIRRWQEQNAEELRRLADRRLAEHLRRLDAIASRLAIDGVDLVAQHDAAAADAWLTDAIAVATWQHWEGLPAAALGEQDLPVKGLPRGLLAADDSAEGAGLWLIDDGHFALARWREVPADG